MRSIKTKFIAFTLTITLLCSTLVGAIALKNMSVLSENDSTDILNLLVQESTAKMDGILGRVEQSVDILADCVDDYVSTADISADTEGFDKISDYMSPVMLNAANVTDGCIGVYIRYSTELTAPDRGLFYTKTSEQGGLETVPCTDISLYSPDDMEHVGWYYVPRDAGKPTWMMPYYNSNINIYMISYIIPLYIGDDFIGIIGMDIDFRMIEGLVGELSAYGTGIGYLTDKDFNIVYHPMLAYGTSPQDESIEFQEVYDEYMLEDYNGNLFHYDYDGLDKVYTYRTLRNGMNICMTVAEKDINKNLNSMMAHIVVFALVAAVISIIVTIVICGTITKPLQKLTAAALKISGGDLDIDIDVHTKDEIGVLADTLQKTTEELGVYIDKINKIAYLDSLTGAENKTAYDAAVKQLDMNVENGIRFAVAVLDLNDLKKTNDTMGHYYGDILISNAAKLIETAFVGCPVYRIGGDEFAVIIYGSHYAKRSEYRANLDAALAAQREQDAEHCISIACGIAEFTEGTDHSYADVFTRADNSMYEEKKRMKRAAKESGRASV